MKLEYVSKQCGEILHIYDHIYKQNYWYFSCKTHADYRKILKLKFKIEATPKEFTDGGFNVYSMNGTDVCFIWTRGKKIEYIVHEVYHAISYVLRRKGIQLSDDTEEAYAYLGQFLIREIIKSRSKQC